jgi:hypothetical protein
MMVESPAPKRDGEVKPRSFFEETSIVTTPENTPRTSARTREASVVRPKPSVTTMAKQSAPRKKPAKAKPEQVTPAEFAQRLREQAATTDSTSFLRLQASDHGNLKARQSSTKLPIKTVQPSQYLRGYVIFYTGGDLTYASARTRGCMNYVRVLLITLSRV